jgi:CheY-like chemotaxis protein
VQILRHEVANDGRYDDQPAEPAPPQRLSHEARNQLHTALMALGLLQRQLELGLIDAGQIDRQIADVTSLLGAIEAGVPSPADATRKVTPRDHSTISPAGGHRKRALVVEDNDNERMLLVDYLQTCDYEVAIAHDGRDALDYLATHDKPDVVLLDMNMPRLDGAATVREIRANPDLCGVKVVAVSGMTPRQVAVDFGPAGVDRWFTKPIRASELVEELDRELAAASAAN